MGKPSQVAENLASGLPVGSRLALAYAPKRAHLPWLALLLLEQRLAETAPSGREPLMIQIRLAWWRDRLGEDADAWPASEPVLRALRSWNGQHGALVSLVDGWESAIIGDDSGTDLRAARVEAYVALARVLGVERLDDVRTMALETVNPQQGPAAKRKVPRAMRPLAILRVLARQEAAGADASPVRDLLRVMRAGLLGW